MGHIFQSAANAKMGAEALLPLAACQVASVGELQIQRAVFIALQLKGVLSCGLRTPSKDK
jgi:hypothetical protein